ncbi:hypothetical protein BJN42_15670 [Pseudomonas koreensis]|jgi:hypothetical protein|uniref:Lipoprotein n=1 Tax=Pseudomonas helmanticensis TaxID=1471381 RepID=A0A4R7VJ94_9PSED|nr:MULTISPECIES: hypothetical protein [Pseudomonas]KPG96956.1 hypothetical protein AK821_13420 [Pseudomonas sp. RIT-PI-r]OFJ44652.1 hypothetical protein BJN42_15670 [Pseudomonas koreensis]TDV49506.1 hypothetical protein EDF87_104152 [Pseudomonas helmanticensis]WGT36114.1 hypothetical protein QG303_11290 [Pseudomonas atacamensis]
MSFNSRLLIPILTLAALLSGCAGPMPKADPSKAWVSFREESQGSLLAEKLDGQRLNDGRFFEVPPGAHRLDVALFTNGPGDINEEQCSARIDFANFQAGKHYRLVESNLGEDYRARLYDAAGHQLGKTQEFNCQPG